MSETWKLYGRPMMFHYKGKVWSITLEESIWIAPDVKSEIEQFIFPEQIEKMMELSQTSEIKNPEDSKC